MNPKAIGTAVQLGKLVWEGAKWFFRDRLKEAQKKRAEAEQQLADARTAFVDAERRLTVAETDLAPVLAERDQAQHARDEAIWQVTEAETKLVDALKVEAEAAKKKS